MAPRLGRPRRKTAYQSKLRCDVCDHPVGKGDLIDMPIWYVFLWDEVAWDGPYVGKGYACGRHKNIRDSDPTATPSGEAGASD